MLQLCQVCRSCRFRLGEVVWNNDNLRLKASIVAQHIGMTSEEVISFTDTQVLLRMRTCSTKCARTARNMWVDEMIEALSNMSFHFVELMEGRIRI